MPPETNSDPSRHHLALGQPLSACVAEGGGRQVATGRLLFERSYPRSARVEAARSTCGTRARTGVRPRSSRASLHCPYSRTVRIQSELTTARGGLRDDEKTEGTRGGCGQRRAHESEAEEDEEDVTRKVTRPPAGEHRAASVGGSQQDRGATELTAKRATGSGAGACGSGFERPRTGPRERRVATLVATQPKTAPRGPPSLSGRSRYAGLPLVGGAGLEPATSCL